MSAIPQPFTDRFRLISRLKFAPKDLELHYQALRDLPEGDLQHAVERAARECDEFPSPKMLRAFITERHTAEARTAAPSPREVKEVEPRTFVLPDGTTVPITREWTYYCDDCRDSGWLDCYCGPDPLPKPWLKREACGRRGEHGSHEWVRLCGCVLRNPDVPRHVQSRARALQKATEAE